MISKLHVARCRKGKMKFGIDIPGTVKEAASLYEANVNTVCKDAIKLEQKNARVAFKLCEKRREIFCWEYQDFLPSNI